jgi:AcrR family transcriptional regulator
MNLGSLERGNASGRATRDLLIRTAERLFAERGIGAVSLREIGQAAGQRNNAVTQYHFGSRQDLIDAIYVYRAASLNRRRWQLLAGLEATGHERDLEEILAATLRPHAESISDPDDNFLGFLARVLTDEARISVVADDQKPQVAAHLDGIRTLRAMARNCLPDLPRAQFERRFDMIFDWAIHALAEFGRSAKKPRKKAEIDQRLDELVAMLANALRALGHKTDGRR